MASSVEHSRHRPGTGPVRQRRPDGPSTHADFDPGCRGPPWLRHQAQSWGSGDPHPVSEIVRLHLHFDKAESSIVRTMTFNGQSHLGQRDEVSHIHAEQPSPDIEMTWRIRIGCCAPMLAAIAFAIDP